jgi:hypothetical protein
MMRRPAGANPGEGPGSLVPRSREDAPIVMTHPKLWRSSQVLLVERDQVVLAFTPHAAY